LYAAERPDMPPPTTVTGLFIDVID